jgi:iron complex outermembrane receptor protein
LNRQTITAGLETRADRAFTSLSQTTDYTVAGTTVPADTFSGGKAINQGAYVQDSLHLSNAATVTIGGRYDYWSTFDGTNKPAATSPAAVDPSRSTSAFSGKIAGIVRVTPSTILRASVGNAFRNPSVYELYTDLRLSSGTQLLANPNVDPERMTSWEGGLRQTIAKQATVDAVYFENRVNDLIYRVTDLVADPTGKIRRLTNAGQARTRGIEVSATQRPASALSFRQTYTFNDGIITSNPALPTSLGTSRRSARPRTTTGGRSPVPDSTSPRSSRPIRTPIPCAMCRAATTRSSISTSRSATASPRKPRSTSIATTC